ncbi:DUF805 domain-containing protein [Cryobacterium roopkundense]|uniref:Uncharacterized membrane protein YhaH (DUF805 family) n=1 Tax=Cryobacterium roopkundense TaxID=1001240 RepID=A0A7W8ZYF4_9MICO|nr:DUF805 domain-containing protein [Cryobacterium roopkundense]MBB5642539.1 uncharacterized membrane protein YhaH (DUF805 family) [Cryobacterium roopkundense]
MMTPKMALRSVLDQYAGFSGRAPRSEYWWWAMWVAAVYIAFYIPIVVLSVLRFDAAGPIAVAIACVWAVVMLGAIVPTISVTVRRLHDANLSGWFYLLNLLVGAGSIAVFVMTLLPSNPAGARFDKVVAKNAAPAWNSQRLS